MSDENDMTETDCEAKIRPLPDDTEITCYHHSGHSDPHTGLLINYAGNGFVHEFHWFEADRRNFRGKWRKCKVTKGCMLPGGHVGNCAV